MCNSKQVNINLEVGDQLTSISCGHIVAELVKFILHQKIQIPYTYQWLKQIVNLRKNQESLEKESLQSERHYRTISSALENLDFVLKSLHQEINASSMPQEVCITLGSSPVTCKEVYRLILPTMCHKLQCQSKLIAADQKLKLKVFRTMVESEALSQAFTNPLPPTNMYVFIRKKYNADQDAIICGDSFVPARGCRIPRSSKVIVIDFRSQNDDNVSCCNDFQIFGDAISENLGKLQISDNIPNDFTEIQSSDNMKWYQSTYVMKGFRDCIVQGSSVTNAWLNQ